MVQNAFFSVSVLYFLCHFSSEVLEHLFGKQVPFTPVFIVPEGGLYLPPNTISTGGKY